MASDRGALSANTRETPATAVKETRKATTYHKVDRGETPAGIAKKYGVSPQLAEWNGMERNANVRIGQKLKIQDDGSEKPAVAARSEKNSRKTEVASNDAGSRKKRSVTTTSTRYETHKVRRGESLTAVAEHQGIGG